MGPGKQKGDIWFGKNKQTSQLMMTFAYKFLLFISYTSCQSIAAYCLPVQADQAEIHYGGRGQKDV